MKNTKIRHIYIFCEDIFVFMFKLLKNFQSDWCYSKQIIMFLFHVKDLEKFPYK